MKRRYPGRRKPARIAALILFLITAVCVIFSRQCGKTTLHYTLFSGDMTPVSLQGQSVCLQANGRTVKRALPGNHTVTFGGGEYGNAEYQLVIPRDLAAPFSEDICVILRHYHTSWRNQNHFEVAVFLDAASKDSADVRMHVTNVCAGIREERSESRRLSVLDHTVLCNFPLR